LALSLALLSASYSNAQDVSSTGNLVNYSTSPTDTTSTWYNGVYVDQLTCWAPGQDGNCGPNPSIRPGGYINFSYGLTDLYQMVNINKALSGLGSGLQVSGFNFGFTAKNGNGWDSGQTDYLNAYVKFYDKSNTKVIENYNWDLNYGFDWTNFNYDKTFSTPYEVNKLGSARYGFVGGDSNFLAGTYGPEIYNVSFNLKYGVDPCATNPLYSPSCAGYMDALAKLTPTTTKTETVTVSTGTSEPSSSPAQTYTIAPSTGSTEVSSTGTTSSTSTTASSTPTASGSQPKAGQVQLAGFTKSLSPSTSQVLSMIGSQQSKNASLANSVTVAAQAQAQSAASAATLQAESIAGDAAAASVTAGHGSVLGAGNAQNSSSMGGADDFGINVSKLNFADTYSTVNDTAASVSYNLLQNGRQASVDVEIPSNLGLKMNSGSPLDSLLNPGLEAPTGSLEQPANSVKKNIQSNELAGGVDIASIATQPQGYQAYSMMMPDVAFYAPKEIYKNQVNVDNARVLRGLGSDRLHQEMVNQQYRLGK